MNFSWDENKARANKIKHKISFEMAVAVFGDANALSIQDRIENGEMRWQTIGRIENKHILLVAHTYFDDDGEEYVRIISARLADKNEVKRYEQNYQI